MGCELGVTSVFEAVRLVVRRVLALPSRSSWTPTPRTPTARRRTRSEDPGIFTEVSRPCNLCYTSLHIQEHAAQRMSWRACYGGPSDTPRCSPGLVEYDMIHDATTNIIIIGTRLHMTGPSFLTACDGFSAPVPGGVLGGHGVPAAADALPAQQQLQQLGEPAERQHCGRRHPPGRLPPGGAHRHHLRRLRAPNGAHAPPR